MSEQLDQSNSNDSQLLDNPFDTNDKEKEEDEKMIQLIFRIDALMQDSFLHEPVSAPITSSSFRDQLCEKCKNISLAQAFLLCQGQNEILQDSLNMHQRLAFNYKQEM